MLILGLAGSPRRWSNSEVLLDEALAGAKEAGAETVKIVLPSLRVQPCIACGACEQTGECAVKDGMQEVYDRLEAAGGIILASPVYFYNVSGFAKAVIDRAQANWVRRYILKDPTAPKGKKGAFIGVAATRGEKVFAGSRLTVKYFYDAVGAGYDRELLIRGLEARDDARKHSAYLEQARDLGAQLVKA